jgi:hypothetical protein
MGTNYYTAGQVCPCCGNRTNSLHIGKKSGGWQFSFRAHPDLDLTSRKAWEAYLSGERYVLNEYGDKITPDAFWQMVDRSRAEKLNHADYTLAKNGPSEYDSKDADGWSFTSREFS